MRRASVSLAAALLLALGACTAGSDETPVGAPTDEPTSSAAPGIDLYGAQVKMVDCLGESRPSNVDRLFISASAVDAFIICQSRMMRPVTVPLGSDGFVRFLDLVDGWPPPANNCNDVIVTHEYHLYFVEQTTRDIYQLGIPTSERCYQDRQAVRSVSHLAFGTFKGASIAWACPPDRVRRVVPGMKPSPTLRKVAHALPGAETIEVVSRGDRTGVVLIDRAEWPTAKALVYRASPGKWFISDLRFCRA